MSVVVENLTQMQVLVDQLAGDLGRSVAVDNPAFELLCASAQIGIIDNNRIAAIINRMPPLEPLPWMISFGIQTSKVPVRLPSNPDFDMHPRLCFPLWQGATLLGYLWLFDEPSVTDDEISLTLEVVARIEKLMGDSHANNLEHARHLALMTEAVINGSVTAIDTATREGWLVAEGSLTVHILQMAQDSAKRTGDHKNPGDHNDVANESDEGESASLAAIRLHRQLVSLGLSRPFLTAPSGNVLVVVERCESNSPPQKTSQLISKVASDVGARIGGMGIAPAASVSELRIARDQAAFLAAIVALRDAGSETAPAPLSWQEAGAWRMLKGWPLERSSVAAISPGANALIANDSSDHWRTVLAYLSNVRNTTVTCKQLYIHRATLHYRLERVRDLIGDEELDDGWQCAALHVALQLYALLEAGHAESK